MDDLEVGVWFSACARYFLHSINDRADAGAQQRLYPVMVAEGDVDHTSKSGTGVQTACCLTTTPVTLQLCHI
jgi:hypothetical protein